MKEEWVKRFVQLLKGESEDRIAFVKAITLVTDVSEVFRFDDIRGAIFDLIEVVIRYRYEHGRPPIFEMWELIEAKLSESK